MSEKPDTWQPIGLVMERVFANLEERHRQAFEKECERDGIEARGNAKMEKVPA